MLASSYLYSYIGFTDAFAASLFCLEMTTFSTSIIIYNCSKYLYSKIAADCRDEQWQSYGCLAYMVQHVSLVAVNQLVLVH